MRHATYALATSRDQCCVPSNGPIEAMQPDQNVESRRAYEDSGKGPPVVPAAENWLLGTDKGKP